MKAYAIAYISACFVAVGLTPLVVWVARAYGLVDRPNPRKVHRVPTPRVGGIAIAGATAAAFLLLTFGFGGEQFDLAADRSKAMKLFIAAMCVFLVGLIDDLRNLPAKLKLLALVVAALALCGSGIRIERLSLGGWLDINLGLWSWVITVLWIVGMTVAMNFIDGLDGLAAGIAAIACGVVAVIGSSHGSGTTTLLALSLMGALTGFLVFNYNPARIFMGDSGSMFLGFMVGACSIAVAPAGKTVVGLGLPAMAMSVPLLDSLLTLIRRGVVHRRSIFAAECGHVHHRLLHIGMSHRNAVIVLHGLSVLGGGVAVALLYVRHPAAAVALVLLPLATVSGVFLLTGSMQVRTSIAAFRRNLRTGRQAKYVRQLADELQLRIRKVVTVEEWWSEVCSAAGALGAVRLQVRRPHGRGDLLWQKGSASTGEGTATCSVSLALATTGAADPARLEVDLAGHSLAGIGLHINAFARLLENQDVSRVLADGTTAASPAVEADAAPVHTESPTRGAAQAPGACRGENLYDPTLAASSETF